MISHANFLVPPHKVVPYVLAFLNELEGRTMLEDAEPPREMQAAIRLRFQRYVLANTHPKMQTDTPVEAGGQHDK